MGVALDVIRQSEVNHVCQVVNVQSACSHIGSYQQLCQVVAELLHRLVALLLVQVAMQRLGIVAVLNQLVGHLLCLYLGATEDNGKDAWIEVYDTFQRQIFILGVHHIVNVVYALGALVAAAYYYLFVVVQILLSYTLHLFAHSGREHQRVMIGRERFEYLVDTV